MEKYMTDDRSQRARAAAEAGTATRDRLIVEAATAFARDLELVAHTFPLSEVGLNHGVIHQCRGGLTACLAHLDELARLIAQRDGYAEAQSIGPDVDVRHYG
jgi:hypothetical protein